MKTELEKYRENLYEIKKRTEVINEHLTNVRNEKYLIIEVEFLALQFRKVLELIALSSLIANKKEYSKHKEQFAKHYNARLIFQDLERINKDFYPVPTKQIMKFKDGKKYFDLQNIKDGFLTKEAFLFIYSKCGGLLHADNPYAEKKDIVKVKTEFPEWLSKIITLLNHHVITLVNGESMIIGLMQGEEDGLPHVFEFSKIKEI